MDAELQALVAEPPAGVEVVRVDDAAAAPTRTSGCSLRAIRPVRRRRCVDEEEPIAIDYTSGTTGQPKGVVYTYRGAYLNALGEVIEAIWGIIRCIYGRCRCSTATAGASPGP